jgi:hypothetical protein
MIEDIAKIEPKRDVCYYVIVVKVLSHKWFPLKGAKSKEKKK